MRDPEQLELDEYSTSDSDDSLPASSSPSTNVAPSSKAEISHKIDSLQNLALKVIRNNPNYFFQLHNVAFTSNVQKEIDEIIEARIKEIEDAYLVKAENREKIVKENIQCLASNRDFSNVLGCANGIIWAALYLAIGIPLLEVTNASASTEGMFYGFTLAPFTFGSFFGIALTKKCAKALVELCTSNIPKPIIDFNIEAQLPKM